MFHFLKYFLDGELDWLYLRNFSERLLERGIMKSCDNPLLTLNCLQIVPLFFMFKQLFSTLTFYDLLKNYVIRLMVKGISFNWICLERGLNFVDLNMSLTGGL